MSPLMVKPLILLAGGVIAASIGFGGGWAINGWRLKADVAEVKQQSAEQRAAAANTALSQLETRIGTMNAQATAAQLDVKTLAVKMDVIRKDMKNAQAQKPLPPDCVPDSVRTSRLRDAIATANAAIAGSAAGK